MPKALHQLNRLIPGLFSLGATTHMGNAATSCIALREYVPVVAIKILITTASMARIGLIQLSTLFPIRQMLISVSPGH